jgi:hypothetical protein
VHVLLIVLVLLIILVPVIYCVVVPQYLQHRLNNMGNDGGPPPVINNINVGEFTSEKLLVGLNAELAALAAFPVSAGINDMNVRILADDKNEIMNLDIPRTEFWVNQPLKINLVTSINFNADNQAATQKLMAKFSTDGLRDFKLVARFNAPILLFGLQIYKGIPLYKEITVGNVDPNLSSIKKLLPESTGTSKKTTGTFTLTQAQLCVQSSRRAI